MHLIACIFSTFSTSFSDFFPTLKSHKFQNHSQIFLLLKGENLNKISFKDNGSIYKKVTITFFAQFIPLERAKFTLWGQIASTEQGWRNGS